MSRAQHPSRRQFVQSIGLAAGAMSLSSQLVLAADEKPVVSRKPDDILARLMEGNTRFVAGKTKLSPRTPEDFARDAGGQSPPAVVLGCADSRVPPELVFDQPVGGLFVVRVAGNILGSGPIMKGSIEFAVAELGARLIIVLGHSECGACKAAIQHIDDRDQLPGAIEGMVDYIRPIVKKVGDAPGDRLVNVTKENARENARRLETLEPILPAFVKKGEVKMVGAYYELKTGKVEILS